MSENDLEARVRLEDPAQNHADSRGRSLDRVAPCGPHHHRELLGVVRVISFRNAGMRQGRMQVDGYIELLGTSIDGPELPLVNEFALGEAVNHGALEAKSGDAALQLVGSSFGIGGGQRCETCKPCRMRRNYFMQPIVHAP